MSIATEITRIQGAKSDLKTAIESKGLQVPSNATIDAYPGYVNKIVSYEHYYTGHVDTEGLEALGWDEYDIQWLQDHVWWDAEDDEYWAVTEENLAFGPNGSTPMTWSNRAAQSLNPDIRYYPKFQLAPTSNQSWYGLFNGYIYVVAIPTHGWDTSYVTSITSMFLNCLELRSVGDLSGWNLGRCTSCSQVFMYCLNLLSVGDLSNWNTSGVTSMSNMFSNCFSLQNLGNLGNWDMSHVTSISTMFSSNVSLEYIGDLSDWDLTSCTNISYTFTNCGRLKDIGNISWTLAPAAAFTSVFTNCYSLSSSIDMSGFNSTVQTTCSALFQSCFKLRGLNANELDVSRMTSFSNFLSSTSIEELDVSSWDLSSCTNVGASDTSSIFCLRGVKTLKLGSKFFKGTPTTYYFQQLKLWTRDSIYESLYTNQTERNTSSTAITVKLSTYAYDTLSQQDKDDIATKNITLTRG